MERYYLAVDIGASSGRHILGHVSDGKLRLEEIHRFQNGLVDLNGSLCWDIPYLYGEVLAGMKKCGACAQIPVSVGIDTWAVDYVLLAKNNSILGNTYGYRDGRTNGMEEMVYRRVPERDLYARTGIQKLPFNTVYQLMAHQLKEPGLLEQADSMMMIPDYLHYCLTGIKASEYTNASTTQLVSPKTCDWDWELVDQLGYPERIFQKIVRPGECLGELKQSVQREVGYNCSVVLPCTHDTASAVAAIPSLDEHPLYLSSGTWSLMGTERTAADCSEESRRLNFTSEGGYGGRYRFLKNIMGLWMIQSVRHEWKDAYSFDRLCELAEEEKSFPSRVDVNDGSFLAPDSMIGAVKNFCRKTGQPQPETVGQISAVIYQSLAQCYGSTAAEVEHLSGETAGRLYVLGGGAKADYLNRLTARQTGKTVIAGPVEATAVGNLAVQMIRDGTFRSLREARTCIRDSFELKTYRKENESE